jgi:hypothetical protein
LICNSPSKQCCDFFTRRELYPNQYHRSADKEEDKTSPMLGSLNPTKTERISYGNNKILAETEARATITIIVCTMEVLNHTCSQCPIQKSYVGSD